MKKRVSKSQKHKRDVATIIFEDAEILFDDEWKEKMKIDDTEYIVPDSEVISIRFSKEDVGKRVRFFIEKK